MLEDAGQTARTEVVERSSQEPHGAGLAGERVEAEVFTVAGWAGRLDLTQLRAKVVTVEVVMVRVERGRVLHQLLCPQPGQQPCRERSEVRDNRADWASPCPGQEEEEEEEGGRDLLRR